MFWLRNQLADHGLNDANVAIQQAANSTPEKGHPDVVSKADHDHAEHGADASQQQDRLATDSIRQAAPVHAHQGLREGEGRDEQAGVE